MIRRFGQDKLRGGACPNTHMTEFPLFSCLLLSFHFLFSWEDSSDSVWPYPEINLLVLVKRGAG